MRKKISSILLGFLLVFAGIFVSACGNKYKNFEFKITYAFSENSESWYDANDGISLNYRVEDDKYVFNINGNEEKVDKNNFNIYLKVEIENVKSKHLDSITISAEGTSGLSFSSSTIKEGKTVKLPIVGLVNSQLSLYENKSGKSTKIGLSVYGLLTDIANNENVVPAIAVGNSIDLNSVRDLIIYNETSGIVTNQTGVNYTLDSFGWFNSTTGNFEPLSLSANSQLKQFLTLGEGDVLTNGKLKLNKSIGTGASKKDFNLTESNNVIRIKAASVYDPEIFTYTYVYIVENNSLSPIIKFTDGANVNDHKKDGVSTGVKGIDLYFNTKVSDANYAGLNQYANSTVTIDDVNSIYKSAIEISNGKTLRYKVVAYIGDSQLPYEFNSAEPVRNLKISEDENRYTLTLASQPLENYVNVKFAYELVCEDDSNVSYPVVFTQGRPSLTTDVEVKKHLSGAAIIANDQELSHGDNINGVIYSTDYLTYQGYKLKLNVSPIDPLAYRKQTITISGINNISVKDSNGIPVNAVGGHGTVNPGKTLYFEAMTSDSQTISLSTYINPTYFDGKEIGSLTPMTVILNLTKKVTADELSVVDGADLSKSITSVDVATTKTSYIFVKAKYKGELSLDTISLVSSKFALNANGDKSVLLSDVAALHQEGVEGDKDYSIYKIAIPATQDLSSSDLTIYAGELGNGASKTVTLNARDLITDESKIEIYSRNIENVKTYNDNKFAIPNGKEAVFTVAENVSTKLVENTIQDISLSSVEWVGNDNFNVDAVRASKIATDKNKFNISAQMAKTAIFNVDVSFYKQDNVTGIISLEKTTIDNVQFAVYNPITNIVITEITNPKIVYVNNLFQEVAKTEIKYDSYSNGATPTGTIYFRDNLWLEESVSNVTSVNIAIDKEISSINVLEISFKNGSSFDVIPNGTIPLKEKAAISGTIQLKLKDDFQIFDNIKFIFTANRFDSVSAVANDATITFAKVEKAEGFDIDYDGEDIVELLDDTREVRLSFMEAAANTISKDFTATPIFKSTIPDENTLQFKDMRYELRKYTYVNGVLQYVNGKPKLSSPINPDDGVAVSIVDGHVVITADKTKTGVGGLYKLELSTLDSYAKVDGKDVFANTWAVNVRVSDGSSVDAAYIIKEKDFEKINNDLDAHYVLGEDISVSNIQLGSVGSVIVPFTGSLSGRLETFDGLGNSTLFNYELNAIINKFTYSSSYNNVYGLFTILEGKISNLNIHITLSNITTEDLSTIGAVVGVNRGTIENVHAYVTGTNNSLVHATVLGGLVGINEDAGIIKNCVVDSSQGLNVTTDKNLTFGGFVGVNEGTIIGQYNGKNSLNNNIKYDSIVNATINITANANCNIAAVAGTSSKAITKMLVGGQIDVKTSGTPTELTGSLAGIVGSSTGNVETVAAVGLNLINENKNGIVVSGIAGKAVNISDAKFVSVLAKFVGFETTGKLFGKTVVGIANDATKVVYSSVESFIKTVENPTTHAKDIFYTLQGGEAYGLINTGAVETSFISANINASEAYLTSDSENTNQTYFIGKVKGVAEKQTNATYTVVISEDDKNAELTGFVDINLTTIRADFDKDYWTDKIKVLSDFEVNDEINLVNLLKYNDANPAVELFFPYIEKDGQPLMILQPSELKADINQDYTIDAEENIYIENIEIVTPTYTITESIIVDFFKNNYNNYENSDFNTHYLVNKLCANCKEGDGECLDGEGCGVCANCTGTGDCLNKIECHKGLIDLTILPSNSTSGLIFELVANYGQVAKIVDNTYLVLTGTSSTKPIILRAYSIFNPEAEAYFAIYSQATFSELVFEGETVTKTADKEFSVNIYQGRNTTISLNANNNDKNGNKFDSILTNNSHLIKAEAILPDEAKITGTENYKFSINHANLKSIIISIAEGYKASKTDSFVVPVNVYLDKAYFEESYVSSDLYICTLNLTVNLNNVATNLDVIGADYFEIDSSSNLSVQAELKTGYVKSGDTASMLPVEIADDVVYVNKDVDNKDSIRMSITSFGQELANVKELVGATYYEELFSYEVFEVKTSTGYKYDIGLSLKDEFNYRYITKDIVIILNIWATSNPNVQDAVEIKIKPTTANTLRVASYAVEDVNMISTTKSELAIGKVESSVISPGGRGVMLLAYVEKAYSNIDSISISSSYLTVPGISNPVCLQFRQYVYNTSTHRFETFYNSYNQDGDTLELRKATSIDASGNISYTGVLYIHALLDRFSGLEARIIAELNVTSNGNTLPGATADLITTFLPGASLTYNGIEAKENGYLVQEGTNGNVANIKLYGYQFNSNPEMNLSWELDHGSNYKYVLNSDNINITSDLEKIEKALKENSLYYYLSVATENQTAGYYKAKSTSDYSDMTNKTFYKITNKSEIFIDVDNDDNYDEYDETETKVNVYDYIQTYFVRNYSEAAYNSADGSYTMEVRFNIKKGIPANFSMNASLSLVTTDGHLEDSISESLMFYPADYVVTDVSVKNTAGNRKMLAINRTDKFELLFTTLREDYDYSLDIYEDILLSDVSNLATLFHYDNKTFVDENTAFDVRTRNNYLNITGLSKFERYITLKLWVGYVFENGTYKLVLSETAADNLQLIEYSFLLQIYPGAGEENATPITETYEMFDEAGNCKLAENGHYILMADLTFDYVKPISFPIGSLDGNNHVIKIKNFVIDKSTTEYGLFANIGTYQDEEQRSHKTILKNVVVDYSEYVGNIEFLNNDMSTIKFGGLVASNNGGLIYNCDVINFSKSQDKTINILVDDNATLTFGGLVATNSGIITNSRVGRGEFTVINAQNDTKRVEDNLAGLTFVLGNDTLSGFNSVAGGFVGENSGTISSSYFANSSLINYSSAENQNENITAGFVGKNLSKATIVYSYVKAKEDTITAVEPYATGARIENKSDGIVAGFVYNNAGNINDCYANTELYTDSTYMAGFVYSNTSSGTISECYAACTFKKEEGEIQNNAQQPFVGKDNENNYLNSGTMYNNYYLLAADGSGDINQTFAYALNATNFKNADNLQGFVFINSSNTNESEQGVWSHTYNGISLILPELMNANMIAHSAKYLYSGNGIEEKFVYTNAASFSEGSKNNPFIIRNDQEFNKILTADRLDLDTPISQSGYIRLIDSIDFGADKTAIKTRVNYTLGDEYTSNITSFEGNGLNINGIYFDVTDPNIEEIGLFAKVKNAYIKNVNLNFVTPESDGYSTTSVKYSGGLAGIITNSAIINVTLNGTNVSLTGGNYVGGLAGLINGSSLLYGISSNLNATASSSVTKLYYSKEDYLALGKSEASYNEYIPNLSYAGGLAGVIDLTNRIGTNYNVAYIDIYGDKMGVKTTENGTQVPNISAQYAGGVSGFASKYVKALKLKYHTGVSDWISGTTAAGGLFGVCLGEIYASQVTALEETQYGYDTEFGKYVLDMDKALDKTKVGNLKLIESSKYAGGLIGVGILSKVESSYSKAGIKKGQVVGGLIGLSIASQATYSYAVPYINVADVMATTGGIEFVGGLFGAAHKIEKNANLSENSSVKAFEELANIYLRRDIHSSSLNYTDIQYTFSTLLMDKAEVIDEEANISLASTSLIQLGYIVPQRYEDDREEYENNIRSGGNTVFIGVYQGVGDYHYTKTGESDSTYTVKEMDNAKTSQLVVMYNLTDQSNETTFKEIFDAWAVIPYWSLKREKYFPLLTSEGVDNYIQLYDADDFKMLLSNPDGKFLVMNDIDLSGWNKNTNWIIPKEFRGELRGVIDNDKKLKKIHGMSLVPTQADKSSGFFETTKGAFISDLEFVWTDDNYGAIKTSKNLTNVSGLSCIDMPYDNNGTIKTSEFRNIEVSVTNNGYLIKQENETTINAFGGLIAQTSSSLISGCSFVGKAQVNLTGSTAGYVGESYFGGLVGLAEKYSGSEHEETSMSILNGKVGASGDNSEKPTTKFDITIKGLNQAYIGGFAGGVKTGSVVGLNVGDVRYTNTDYQSIKMNVKINKVKENNSKLDIAGLIGLSDKTSVAGSNANTEITVAGEDSHLFTTSVAGLISLYQDADSKSEISNSNAKSIIDVSSLKTNTILAAGGVAILSSGNENGVIKQCLFTGSITAETAEDTSELEATTIYAGGAVATTKESVIIKETMSTVDITIGSSDATGIYAGGFVGYVDYKEDKQNSLELINVVSSGKLVPFGGANAGSKAHLGGMIGSVDDDLLAGGGKPIKINNSYTLTSIISDALAGNVLQNTFSDALVGYSKEDTASKVETTNVYYSTDYALTTNDHNYGNNLSASALMLGSNSVWKDAFVNAQLGVWDYVQVSRRVPYIKALSDSLKMYAVLTNTGELDYVAGSSLNPCTEYKDDFKEKFNYYILTSVPEIGGDGTFNGVLIGGDSEISRTTSSSIKKLAKHSAISNVHVNVETGSSIEGENAGIIVNENEGLIFNCSVQGQNIGVNANIGVIAQTNIGTISHSYSGIEITDVGNNVAGIVYNNKGVINSCYFIGYINNRFSFTAAGIMAMADTGSYVYNSYMAGVIVNVNSAGTSFYAGAKNVDGLNNYVDQFANNEILPNSVTGLKSVTTAELMLRTSTIDNPYMGKWHTTVKTGETGEDDATIKTDSNPTGVDGTDYKAEKIASFGYNFGYPIYNFSKRTLNGTSDSLFEFTDIRYSVYTGTGETSYTVTGETSEEEYLEDRRAFVQSNDAEYNKAYKIPHLGVLTVVHGLQKSYYTTDGTTSTNIGGNFVIIYNLYGRASRKVNGTMIEWQGVGLSTDATYGFASTGEFTGVLTTNSGLSNSYDEGVPNSHILSVEGLNTTGLLNEVGASYIADIELGSFGENDGLKDSGPIAKTVVGVTTIDNISYKNDSVVIGTNFGGLVGTINSSLNVKNFNSKHQSEDKNAVTLQGDGINSSAGLIAYQLGDESSDANLILALEDVGGTGEQTNELYPFFKNVGTAGGLVAIAHEGKITGNKHIINIDNNVDTTEAINSYGGIVGSVAEKADVEIDWLIVNFVSNSTITANSFGGFVSTVSGKVLFTDCSMNGAKITLNSQTAGQVGTLVGNILSGGVGTEAYAGDVTISTFELTSKLEITTAAIAGETSSFGGFVGTQNGKFTIDIKSSQEITIKGIRSNIGDEEKPGITNVGGFVGHYIGGEINICGSLPTNISLQGYKNVGGIIGLAEAWPIRNPKPEFTDAEGVVSIKDSINFENLEKFATIVIGEFSSENFGGLFGQLKGTDSPIAKSGEIVNNNEFKMELNKKSAPITVKNIGGVAGLVEGEVVLSGLSNAAALDFSAAYNFYFKNVGGVVGNFKGKSITTATNSGEIKFYDNYSTHITTHITSHSESTEEAAATSATTKQPYAIGVNVGGVIGLVELESDSFKGFKNSAPVSGYQNVGGLIGYAKGIALTGSVGGTDNIYLESGTTLMNGSNAGDSAGVVAGVVNVGGAIGYAESSTIQQVGSQAKVYGNTNVGGLIGYSNDNELTNNIVGTISGSGVATAAESDEGTTINAIYYNYHKNGDTDYVSFIPTGVGGLLGASQSTTITSNIVSEVKILSTAEGADKGSITPESKGMISTIRNYMSNVGAGDGGSIGDDDLTNSAKVYELKDRTLDFAKITSGFGGFIGTLDGTSANDGTSNIIVDDVSQPDKHDSSYMKDITINVPLGINVGTYYGYYKHDEFKAPKLYGTTNVDGAYNIGGVAGYVSGEVGSVSTNFKTTGLFANATVKLQSNMIGMYVGGMFGKAASNNVYVEIRDNKIEIDTSKSYYIGGFVGQLEVSTGNQFKGILAKDVAAEASIEVKQLKITTSDIDKIESAQNFGGLVGMLKCGRSSNGGTFSVQGEHYYPFTVNTIENENYADGKPQYDTEIDDQSVYLSAQANYINQDSFNISASKGDWYSNNPTRSKNPLNSNSKGWAKEYTGFKQMQRCIPQAGLWDSIAVVYNAEWITEVGTVGNLGLLNTVCDEGCANTDEDHVHTTIRKRADKEEYFYVKGITQVDIDEQHIVYTVTQRSLETEMLYSAIGIAEIAQVGGNNVTLGAGEDVTVEKVDKNNKLKSGKSVTIKADDTSWYTWENDNGYGGFGYTNADGDEVNDTNYTIAEYYYIRNLDEENKLFGFYKSYQDEGEETSYLYTSSFDSAKEIANSNRKPDTEIRKLNQLNSSDLLYFNWIDSNGNYKTDFVICKYEEEEGSESTTIDEQVKLNYFRSLDDKFYDFKVIYANSSLSAYSSLAPNNIPNSGSVFEIYGLKPSLNTEVLEKGPTWWEKNGWWVILIIEVVLMIATWGLAAWLNTAKFVIKLPNLMVKGIMALRTFTHSFKYIKFAIAIIAASAFAFNLAGMTNRYGQSTTYSRSLYFDTEDQNFGLLTVSVVNGIRYSNNVLVPDNSIVLEKEENGNTYTFHYYSQTRPADYYSDHYIIPKQNYNEDEDIFDQGFTDSLAYGDTRIRKKSGCIYSFDFNNTIIDPETGNTTTETLEAQLKYIYHEGAYYYNSMSMQMGLYRTQELNDPTLVAKTDAQAVYDSNGIAYVLGNYDTETKTYSFNDSTENMNNVTRNGNTYYLNGKPISGEKEFDVEYVGVGSSHGLTGDIVEGYDFLHEAYYTTIGDSTNNASYKKYATFEYFNGTPEANWTIGVDYVEVGYNFMIKDNETGTYIKDGTNFTTAIPEGYTRDKYKSEQRTAIFTIKSMSDSGSETGRSVGFVEDIGELNGKTVTLAAYPTCFKNPYQVSVSGTYKDSNYYVAKSVYTGSETASFKFKVKYFYFEGGYMLWQDFGSGYKVAEGHDHKDNNGNDCSINCTLENAIYTQVDVSEGSSNGYIGIYKKDGTRKQIKLYGTDNVNCLICTSGTTYTLNYTTEGGWYIYPITEDMYDETNKADKLEQELYGISVNFVVRENDVWRREESYKLDKEGYVNKIYGYNPTADSKACLYNKYLSYNNDTASGYKGVYTMFKYNNDDLSISKWKAGDDDKAYYLIPTKPNRSRPNTGVNATYLVESCKVALGGGVQLNYTTGAYKSSGPRTGEITIE